MHLHSRHINYWILAASLAAFAASGMAQTAYVSTLGPNNITFLSTVTNSFAGSVPIGGQPSGLKLTPDGTRLYIACQGTNSVMVMSTASNSIIATIPVGTTPIRLAVSPNGAQVYVANEGSNSVSVIDVASNSVIGTVPVGSRPMDVAFSPDGSNAYVTNYYGASLSVINTASRSVSATLPTGYGPQSVVVRGDGVIFVACQFSNVVDVFGAAGNSLGTISGLTYPSGMALSSDGSRLYVANSNAATLSVVYTGTLQIIATVPVAASPTSVKLSTDGSLVYVVSQSMSSVTLVSTALNAVSITVRGIGPYPFDIAVKPGSVTAPPPLPSTPSCSFSLGSTSANLGAGAGGASVGLSASASSCSWSTTTDSNWLNVTSALSGSGSANISYSATANTGSSSRTGHLTIAGLTFTVTQQGVAFSAIRVNAGGGQITDGSGNVWAAGNPTNYSVTTNGIAGANPPALYQSEAWSTSTLQYQYSVPNGSHTVKLKFAEFYLTQRGQRTFNIVVNGSTWMANFDILAYTSPNTAYDVSIPVNVTNGQVVIQLVPVTGAAKVDGIEID